MKLSELERVLFLGGFFLLSVFFSFLVNWFLLKISFNFGVKNSEKSQVRWTANVKPAVGGISFFIVFLISISLIGLLPRTVDSFLDKRLLGIMAASSLGFIVGLADDAYNTNPLMKFIGQLSCAFILLFSDIYIPVSSNLAFNYAITILWVIGLMNSINMLDNMDGITTSISASIIIGLIAVFFSQNSIQVDNYIILMVGVLGSLFGFLFYNWHPSKIYMGDTGSQFLGVFLSASAILYIWGFSDDKQGNIIELKQFVIPILIFIIPLIDTTTVTIRRLMRKQSPFVGGKDHITHHLVYLGLKDTQVALLLSFISLLSIPVACLLVAKVIDWSLGTNLILLLYAFSLFLLFQYLYNKGAAKHKQQQ